jgi:hypothetical protein
VQSQFGTTVTAPTPAMYTALAPTLTNYRTRNNSPTTTASSAATFNLTTTVLNEVSLLAPALIFIRCAVGIKVFVEKNGTRIGGGKGKKTERKVLTLPIIVQPDFLLIKHVEAVCLVFCDLNCWWR